MERQRPLVLKPAPIRNHSSLLYAHIHPDRRERSLWSLPLDFHLDRDIPVPCFTGDGCPQDLAPLPPHLFARLPLLHWSGCLPPLDKAQLFGQIYRSQFAFELASILLLLALIQDEAAKSGNGDPMASQRQFIIGQIERLVRLALLLVLRVLGAPSKEVGIGLLQIVKGSLHHALGHVVGPRISRFPNRIELFFEAHRVGRLEGALRFWNHFLLQLVRLILCFPVRSAPVIDESSGATSPLEILHLFRSRIHPDFVRRFHF